MRSKAIYIHVVAVLFSVSASMDHLVRSVTVACDYRLLENVLGLILKGVTSLFFITI